MREKYGKLIGEYAPKSAQEPLENLVEDSSAFLLGVVEWQFGVAGVNSCNQKAFEDVIYSAVRKAADIMFAACQSRELDRSRKETGNLLGMVVRKTLGDMGAPEEVSNSVAKSLKVKIDLEDPETKLEN